MTETTQNSVLTSIEIQHTRGESISKIVSDTHFIRQDTQIGDLSVALIQDDGIEALGVVDEKGRVVGLLDRLELYNLLGRPFGLDVLKKKPVSELMQDAIRFHFERNIYSVSDIIDENLRSAKKEFFLLVDENSRFRGIFSSVDMLMYLSDITKKDIALARTLQNRVVKEEELIEGEGFSLINTSQMAKGVGGDFYACDHYTKGKIFLSVCDVSGKGVAASLLTSAMWGIYSLRSYRESVQEFIITLNSYLYRTFEAERFVTAIFCDFDAEEGTLDICDLGHSYIYLYREGTLHKLKIAKSNPPLGIFDALELSMFRMTLQKGDMVLIVTDGLIEQTNSEGIEYPLRSLKDILVSTEGMDLRTVKTTLLEDFYHFRGTQAQHDDVTFSLLRYDL